MSAGISGTSINSSAAEAHLPAIGSRISPTRNSRVSLSWPLSSSSSSKKYCISAISVSPRMLRYLTYSTSASTSPGLSSANDGIELPATPLCSTRTRSAWVGLLDRSVLLNLKTPGR